MPVSILPIALLAACSGDDPDRPPGSDDTVTDHSGGSLPVDELVVVDVTGELHPTFGTLVKVMWRQSATADVFVEFSSPTAGDRRSPTRTLDRGLHEEWLLGATYDEEVTWRVVAEDAAGDVVSSPQSTTTSPRPADLRLPTVTIDDRSGQDPAANYILTTTSSGPGAIGGLWWVQLVDRAGRVVWAMQTPERLTTMHPRIALDGRSLLFDRNSWWGALDQGRNSSVDRLTLDGAILESWTTPGLHHDFVDLPDGSLVYGSYLGWGYDDEDLVEIAPDRSRRVIMTCAGFLRGEGLSGSCGSNTVTYDAARDHLLWSMFTLDTILDVDRATGDVDRWFGQLPGAWAFDPPDAGLFYSHGAVLTPTGTLLTSTHVSEEGQETVVREYELDAANSTLHLVWDFGVGDGLWGAQLGEAHRMPGGNTLHNLGTYPRLREATPQGEVVWDIEWPPSTIGRSVWIDDPYDFVGERH
jgi:hypothetical protein